MKTADEKLEHLEKTVRTYRVLAISMGLLIFVMQRDKIVKWVDSVERWVGSANAR
ncbi:MAG: hypothetical protein JNM07_03730 [Phycisphaerae bacterium]|nr:hypothetical protein [Phycisphaerae bacterium]